MRAGLLAFLCFLAALLVTSGPVQAQPAEGAPIRLGHSTAPLNGPWRFHLGDDPHWASPDFDDAAWETVDLTPPPGAHDGDVGLPGYVPGWNQRGHANVTGYAWYRLKVSVTGDGNAPLALAGPTLVDSTYELYVDGKRLGGPGVFSTAGPTVFAVRPTVFSLSALPTSGAREYVIAIRVWMDPSDAGSESGGIHIAPTIGDAESIGLLHQVQWLRTFNGYVVDAVEPLAFVVLAIMAGALFAARTDDRYASLVVALLLLALLRVNQVTYAWGHFQSLRCYDIATAVVIKPLALAAWILAWRDWFRVRNVPWLRPTVITLAIIYLVCAWLGRPWFMPDAMPTLKAGANLAVEGARVLFAILFVGVVCLGVARWPKPHAWLSALCALLVGIGLFATELNALGVPGIWFPWGVGVARGQYAYAAFIPLLFLLLLFRLCKRKRA